MTDHWLTPDSAPVTDATPPAIPTDGGRLHWWERDDLQGDRSLLPCLTSLDPPETNGGAPSARLNQWPDFVASDYPSWRHARCRTYRTAALAAMSEAGVGSARLSRYRDCGDKAWLYRSLDNPAAFRIMGSACRDRFCPTCQAARARVIRQNLADHVSPDRLKFLTLTLAADLSPLSTRIDRLFSCFRTLRRLPFWRDRVAGGAAFLEFKYHPQHRSWHTHLHCLLQSEYMDQRALSRCWLQVTGNSPIVDVRAIHDPREVASYVTKYLTKPSSIDDMDSAVTGAEIVRALHGRHTCMTMGTWRGWQLTDAPSSGNWAPVCAWRVFCNALRAGIPQALSIAYTLWRGDPIDVHHVPSPHQSLDSAQDSSLPYEHHPPGA